MHTQREWSSFVTSSKEEEQPSLVVSAHLEHQHLGSWVRRIATEWGPVCQKKGESGIIQRGSAQLSLEKAMSRVLECGPQALHPCLG